MNLTYRPIAHDWYGELTRSRRPSPFQQDLTNTSKLLAYEVGRLGRTEIGSVIRQEVVVQLALFEMDLRVDGTPKMKADYDHPGVIVSFDSVHGPLRYQTDVFDDWRANLRAVALGLEALRKVDRYGIARRGEQYTGWKAIESGFSRTEAERLIESYGGRRKALMATHPDQGGDPDEFRRVQEALQVIWLNPSASNPHGGES